MSEEIKRGKGKVVAQRAGRGHFAEVHVELTRSTNKDESTIILADAVDDWHEAIQFGAAVADQFTRGYNVRVTAVRYLYVDTTHVDMALATVDAILDALKVEWTRRPYLNEQGRVVW